MFEMNICVAVPAVLTFYMVQKSNEGVTFLIKRKASGKGRADAGGGDTNSGETGGELRGSGGRDGGGEAGRGGRDGGGKAGRGGRDEGGEEGRGDSGGGGTSGGGGEPIEEEYMECVKLLPAAAPLLYLQVRALLLRVMAGLFSYFLSIDILKQGTSVSLHAYSSKAA
ncbi:hypothetical protein FHG87_017403 [Trinorchestia longiramus]|nr:hypothetical protein FHG87_017403 [Trinorchestia longiramus]